MTRTGFVWDERFMWHDSRTYADWLPTEALFEPEPALESVATKRRFKNLLDVTGIADQLVRIPTREADVDEIAMLHSKEYIERIQRESAYVGGDAGDGTPFGRGSYEIALRATGGCMNAVDMLLDGEIDNGYALVRPPGHHAERDTGRGYCIFGNTALSAMHARKRGLARVAIVDFDVHHGNGTEHAFYDDPSVLTISLHQDRLYPPESGSVDDIGEGAGVGANLNIPLPPGGGRAAYEHAFNEVVIPALDRFQPELLLVASGLDASMYDPNARMNLSAACFGRLSRMLIDAAGRHAQGRVLFIHEGGYSSMYVPYCGLRIVEELSGIQSGVPDALNDGDPSIHPLHDHERAAVTAAAANVGKVPTP